MILATKRFNRKALALLTVWSSVTPFSLTAASDALCPELLQIEQRGNDLYARLSYKPADIKSKRITQGPMIVGALVELLLRKQQICDSLDSNTHTYTLPGGGAYPVISAKVWDDGTSQEEEFTRINLGGKKDVICVWDTVTGQWLLKSILDPSMLNGTQDIQPKVKPQPLPSAATPSQAASSSNLLPAQYSYTWNCK